MEAEANMQELNQNESIKERRTVTFFYKEIQYICHLVRDCPNNDECSDWYIEELTPRCIREVPDEELYGEVTGEAVRIATEAETLFYELGKKEADHEL
jgi:hypothetical protein